MPSGVYIRTKSIWNKGTKGIMKPNKTSFRKGNSAPITAFKKGTIPWNKGKKGIMPIPWNKDKKTGIRPWLGKKRPNISGEKHPHWKGGITSKNHQIRQSLEYKIWRRAVFERDKYQCIWGGKSHGHKLQVDHIKPFADYPELRFAIDNGRTLCVECHKKTNTYLKSDGRNQYSKNLTEV